MAERSFGPYRLVQQIAVGGMAEIYLAKARGIGGFEKYLALKVIHPNFAEDEHFIKMLIDEAKIAVQLQHVNIAQIFDLGQMDGAYYIAMEFVDGGDLFRLLRRASEINLTIPIELGAYVAQEVCAALDYAHNKKDDYGRPLGIIHRDVSPQNVLISYAGEVKLVDFGIAKAAQRLHSTAAGVIKGKYYYMSPEQAWGDPVDHRTDVFSTGILLYEMLVGQMLYLEESMTRLLDRVRKAEIAPPRSLRADLPAELEEIAVRALARRPEDRYPSAHALGEALERFLFSYAPDVSAARLAAFVDDLVGEGEDRARIVPSAGPRGVTREVISRADYQPDRNHSVLYRPDGARAKGGGSRSARAPDQHTAPHAEFEEDDGTIVSGPPSFLPNLSSQPEESPDGLTDVVDLSGTPVPPAAQLSPAPAGADAPRLVSLPSLPGIGVPGPAAGRRPAGGGSSPPASAPARPAARGPAPGGRVSTLPVVPAAGAPRTAPPPIAPASAARRTGTPSSAAAPTPAASRAPAPAALQGAFAALPRPPAGGSRPPTAGRRSAPAPAPSDGMYVFREPPPAAPEAAEGSGDRFGADSDAGTIALPQPARVEHPPPPTSAPQPYLGADSLVQTLAPGVLRLAPPARATSLPPIPPIAPLPATGGRSWLLVGLAMGLIALAVAIGIWMSAPAPGAAPAGRLKIVSVPPNAAVRLDGEPLAQRTPVAVQDLDRGRTHRLEVSLPGYKGKVETIDREEEIIVVLQPDVGTVMVESDPTGAEVYLNGRPSGTTPVTLKDVPFTGENELELRLRGYRVQRQPLDWNGQRQLQLRVRLRRAN